MINDTTIECDSGNLEGRLSNAITHNMLIAGNNQQLNQLTAASISVTSKPSVTIENIIIESIPSGHANALQWRDILINGSNFDFSDRTACVINNDIIY